MAKTLKTGEELQQEIAEHKDKDGYSQKLYKPKTNNYKVVADEHKTEVVANEIKARSNALMESDERGKVDLHDIEQVKARTKDYFDACAAVSAYPSVMGLAVYGFGITRQALNQFLQRHPDSQSAEFINKAKDVMADILTNAGLYNTANAVQVMFQLKNHFEHADKAELTLTPKNPLGDPIDKDVLMEKYMESAVPPADYE